MKVLLNAPKVLCCLFHVTLPSSLKRFNELLSAVLHYLDVLLTDGQILSFYIVLSEFDVVFVISIEHIIFAQLVTILIIFLNDQPEVLDLSLNGELSLLVLR